MKDPLPENPVATVAFAPTDTRESEDWRSGQVCSFGEEGFFVTSNTLWPPRTALTLVLTIPGERHPLRLRGEVSWARTADPAGMFVAFAEGVEAPVRARLVERTVAAHAAAALAVRSKA